MEKVYITNVNIKLIAPILYRLERKTRKKYDELDKYFSFNELGIKKFYEDEQDEETYSEKMVEEFFGLKLLCIGYIALSSLDKRFKNYEAFKRMFERLANKCEYCNSMLLGVFLCISDIENGAIPSEMRLKVFREYECKKAESIIDGYANRFKNIINYLNYEDLLNHSFKITDDIIEELNKKECPNHSNKETFSILLIYAIMGHPVNIHMYMRTDKFYDNIKHPDNVKIHQKAVFDILKDIPLGGNRPSGIMITDNDFNNKNFIDDMYPGKGMEIPPNIIKDIMFGENDDNEEDE